jgi:hypothetical protein
VIARVDIESSRKPRLGLRPGSIHSQTGGILDRLSAVRNYEASSGKTHHRHDGQTFAAGLGPLNLSTPSLHRGGQAWNCNRDLL